MRGRVHRPRLGDGARLRLLRRGSVPRHARRRRADHGRRRRRRAERDRPGNRPGEPDEGFHSHQWLIGTVTGRNAIARALARAGSSLRELGPDTSGRRHSFELPGRDGASAPFARDGSATARPSAYALCERKALPAPVAIRAIVLVAHSRLEDLDVWHVVAINSGSTSGPPARGVAAQGRLGGQHEALRAGLPPPAAVELRQPAAAPPPCRPSTRCSTTTASPCCSPATTMTRSGSRRRILPARSRPAAACASSWSGQGAPAARVRHHPRHSQARNASSKGVLKLTLRATGYAWEFLPVAGATYGDTGRGTCVPAA